MRLEQLKITKQETRLAKCITFHGNTKIFSQYKLNILAKELLIMIIKIPLLQSIS